MEEKTNVPWIDELEVNYFQEITSVQHLKAFLKSWQFTVILVISGAIDFKNRDNIVSVTAGSIYIIPYNLIIVAITGRVRICLITCSTMFAFNSALSKFGSRYWDFVLIHRGILLTLERGELGQMLTVINLLKKKVNLNKKLMFRDDLIALCFNLLIYELGLLQYRYGGVSVFAHQSRKEQLALNFIALIKQHCREHHNVRYYAGLLFVSTGHLSKAVRGAAGQSAKHFIEMAILSEAYLLLANENMTISVVSEELGFSSPSVFSNFFKKYGKLSPTQYRLTLGPFVKDKPMK